MKRSAVTVFFLSLGAAACGGAQRYENPAPSHVATVRMWIQKHPHLSEEYALQGCELWKEKGIRCVRVSERKHSDIQVVALARPCVPGGDGTTTLAHATSGGQISIITDCFVDDKNKLNGRKFRAVMGHEVGHELGIWTHVPEKCEKGVTICGRALMNPMYDPAVDFITPADSLAFDARDLKHAVIGMGGDDPVIDAPQSHGDVGCEYTTKPR